MHWPDGTSGRRAEDPLLDSDKAEKCYNWNIGSSNFALSTKIFMVDVLTKKQRRYCMSRIRSKNTKIEKTIFKLLNNRKLKYKKHYNLPGKPDMVFPELKLAVFINSDFWHGWRYPTWKKRLSNKYWQKKISTNIKRDRKNYYSLRRKGWKILKLWEHSIKKDPLSCVKKIIDKNSGKKPIK